MCAVADFAGGGGAAGPGPPPARARLVCAVGPRERHEASHVVSLSLLPLPPAERAALARARAAALGAVLPEEQVARLGRKVCPCPRSPRLSALGARVSPPLEPFSHHWMHITLEFRNVSSPMRAA